MEKKNLMFQNLLTWEDIIALGDPKGENDNHFGYDFWHRCCNKNYDKRLFDENVENKFIKELLENFNDLPVSIQNFDFRVCLEKDEKENWQLKLSKIYFAHWILKTVVSEGQIMGNESEQLGCLVEEKENLKQLVEESLLEYKRDICETIYQLNQGKKLGIVYQTTKERSEVSIQDQIQKRKIVNWFLKNIDKLFEFAEREINLEILDTIDKDKFLLNLASSALLNSNILKLNSEKMKIEEFMECLKDKSVVTSLNYLNNYFLMIEYLEQENQEKYETVIYANKKNRITFSISNNILKTEFHRMLDFLKKNQQLESYWEIVKPFSSYEELLSTKVSKTWKKIQNQKLAENIRLNWELIPSGKKISLKNYSEGRKNPIFSTNQLEKQLALKKAYDLVEDKMEYFSQTNPLFELTGIDTFTGYSAYMYQNGVVVFEKFFKETGKKEKNFMIPVSGEAIYVMNFQEFADLSKYTKMELIQEIVTFHNPNVKRILHTKSGSWKQKVDQVIQGEGYQQLDLEQIDTLALELSSRNKQLKKEPI